MSRSSFKHCFILTLAVVACLAIGCRDRGLQLSGSRFAGFGASELVTEYRRDSATNREIALLHVLFVSPLDPPANDGFLVSGGGSGTVEDYALDYTYSQSSGKGSIRSEPVRILNGTTVRVSDQEFRLERGNVFVAEITMRGAVHLTQLQLTLRDKATTPNAVLAAIKGVVNNPRVQALKSAS